MYQWHNPTPYLRSAQPVCPQGFINLSHELNFVWYLFMYLLLTNWPKLLVHLTSWLPYIFCVFKAHKKVRSVSKSHLKTTISQPKKKKKNKETHSTRWSANLTLTSNQSIRQCVYQLVCSTWIYLFILSGLIDIFRSSSLKGKNEVLFIGIRCQSVAHNIPHQLW